MKHSLMTDTELGIALSQHEALLDFALSLALLDSKQHGCIDRHMEKDYRRKTKLSIGLIGDTGRFRVVSHQPKSSVVFQIQPTSAGQGLTSRGSAIDQSL